MKTLLPVVKGAEGCKHIKANGGTTFAPDMSADVDGMSLSAQASGCVDLVLPPHKIPAALKRLARTLATKKSGEFDPKRFLAIIGEGRKQLLVPATRAIYPQGAAADTVFYIQKGAVRLTGHLDRRQGSDPGHIESRGFLRRGVPDRTALPFGVRSRCGRLRTDANREEGDDAYASPTTPSYF